MITPDSSETFKTVRFNEYWKLRKLEDYVPPGTPPLVKKRVVAARRQRITVLELLFNDFRPVYDRLHKQGLI
jgi:hypothetical protein